MDTVGIVKTKYGALSGKEVAGITGFFGIPYAKPPVGDLRWKRPQEPESWEGVRDATRFGTATPQPITYFDPPEGFSEDCLYLNIWTPARHGHEKLPVYFWIHGGGFVTGGGNEPMVHAWHMAAKGIVVVTINYRMGLQGFFSHPQLDGEDELGISGNYGIWDMVRALEWVRDNIEGFGGDKDNVTIAGQSAGGMSVCSLLASPKAWGLYHRAIIQSGGPGLDRRGTDLKTAEAQCDEIMRSAGYASVEEFRKASIWELLKIRPEVVSSGPLRPVKDGVLLPEDPSVAFLMGKIAPVPIMFGSNDGEGSMLPRGAGEEGSEQFLKDYAGEDYEKLMALYRRGEKDWRTWNLEMGRDKGLVNLQFFAGRMKESHPEPVYQYYFSQPLELVDGRTFPSDHSAELFYMWQKLYLSDGLYNKGAEVLLLPRHRQLADLMEQAWVNFTRTGDPNGYGVPQWPVAAEGKFMRFDSVLGCGAEEPAAEKLQLQLKLMERNCPEF